MQMSSQYAHRKSILALSLAFLVLGLAACSKAPTDASLGEAVKARLYSDSVLKDDRIDVAVSGAEVTLTGEVSTDAARLQAYKLARETPGVRAVTDSMQLKPPPIEAAQAQPVQAQPIRGVQSQPQPPEPSSGAREGARSPSQTPASPSPKASEAPKVSEARRPVETASAKPPAAARAAATIPAGTTIGVRMIDSIDSKASRIGDTFEASLDAPIVVGRDVVVPEGAKIYVTLTSSKTAGKLTGQSELKLELDHMEFQGKSYPLTSSEVRQVGQSRGQDTAKKTAIGAAVGAVVGAVAGGKKGAAIGAGAGAGAGVAAQIFIEGKQVQVPSETRLDFRLEQPVDVTRSTR